jgi:carboxyl-terminal processing protease
LKTGDIIVNVDGTDTSAVTPEETAALLRGKENTKATLTVVRGTESLNFAAVRKPIKLKGVESYVKEVNGKKTGIVRIKQFSSTTRDDVMHAMEDFHKDFDRPKVLVVDMRNNAGGLLQGAVETANLFLPPGKIVTYVVEKDGLPKAQQTLPNGVPSADPDLPDQRTPLYLLVNGNTASAAEVLSAALMENDRAILVGQKTFGKGVIQNLQGLRQGGVAITIAKYETPNHNNINKIGIPVSKEIADCEPTTAADVCMAQVL